MPNPSLFRTTAGPAVPPADTTNAAGGIAYSMPPREALAIYATTGTLYGTYYAEAEEQLETVLALAKQCPVDFIAKLAVYARQRGNMKDMPVALCAYLAGRKDGSLTPGVFHRVVDNGKQLRSFVQMVRAGAFGRKSLGSLPKRLAREWFTARRPSQVWNSQIGQGGMALRDVIRLARPKPASEEMAAVLRYLLDKPKPEDFALLPDYVREFVAFRKADAELRATLPLPDVNFQLLTDLELTEAQWQAMARNATWQQARQNLNHFGKHGAWKSPETVLTVAALLKDPAQVKAARAFPHQLLMAYQATEGTDIPPTIRNALQDAMEVATENIPPLPGHIVVAVDVSGSMGSAVTGRRGSASSKVRCVDVAALMASAILRQNPNAMVLPFDTQVYRHDLNPRDSVMTNAAKLARYGGGGTECRLPLNLINHVGIRTDGIIFLSDCESWVETYEQQGGLYRVARHGTGVAMEWAQIKARNPKCKMVCVNINPNDKAQTPTDPDVLRIGGFNDSVFTVASAFFAGSDGQACVRAIEEVDIS